MHLAYSALRKTSKPSPQTERLDGYAAACHKHRDTIAAIRQYIPGWMPPLHQPANHTVLKACSNQ